MSASCSRPREPRAVESRAIRTIVRPRLTNAIRARDSTGSSGLIERDTPPRLQLVSRPLDPAREPRVIFKLVVEPVIFRREADQHTRGLAMASHDNRGIGGPPEIPGEIVLYLG